MAVLTRNAYGARILNAARVLFIDVDLAEPLRSLVLLRRLAHVLFRRLIPPPRDPATAALSRLREWIVEHPDWGVRVYRTRSGLRYLVTHAPFEPGSTPSEVAMEYLGCDPRYVQLCRSQKSFRARLSPKPWRCGVGPPPVRYPWTDESEERAMRAWEAQYALSTEGWATCALLDVLGNESIDLAVRPVVALHDELTRADSGFPLA